MTDHELKTWPAEFQAVLDQRKRFDLRVTDRSFQVDDILVLREYQPATTSYTGREARVRVTYLLFGPTFGLPEGLVIMSINLISSR